MKKLLLIFTILYSINIYSQLIYPTSGYINNIEFKENKVTIYYQNNFDGSLCNGCGFACLGQYSNIKEFTTNKALHNPSDFNSVNTILKTNSYDSIRGIPQVNDSFFNPYICLTQDTSLYCFFDAGLPTISNSYQDENNFIHYIGYVGGHKGGCYNLPAYKLRYTKYNTKVSTLNNQTTYSPDSLIQFYDIESYNPNNRNVFNGLPTFITSTADKQQLILYLSPDTTYNLTGGGYTKPTGFHLVRLDSSLDITYSKNLFSGYFSDSSYLNLIISKHTTRNGKILIGGYSGYYKNNTYSDTSFNFLIECDSNGIILNETLSTRDNFLDSIFRKYPDFYISTTDTTTTINYYNTIGDLIKSITFNEKLSHNFIKTKDNKYVFMSVRDGYYGINAFISVYDSLGNLRRNELIFDNITYDAAYLNLSLAVDSFNNVFFFHHTPTYQCGLACGGTFINFGTNIFNLEILNHVDGKIIHDINNNCIFDTTELSLKNILVELKLNNKSYYTLSNDSGNYKFTPYDTGHGKVIVHLNNQTVFTNACNDTFDIIISDTLQNPIVNFLLHEPNCNAHTPKVTVDISTPFLRRCFDNIYTISLTNESNDTSFNTYVDVELDNDLIPVDTAFLSAQNLGNNSYRFNIGTLHPLQNSRKNLMVNVRCDSTILGQTHCVKATSFPYLNCVITDAKYMQAIASCRNDSVIFIIENVGFPEAFQQDYRIIADDSIVDVGTLNFTPSFSTNILSYYNPEGKTYRLETRQYPVFIGEDTVLSIDIEGCGNNNFSTGYITQFIQDDDAPNVSIDCHQNVGSFDPNDKSAQPVGYGNQHLIENTNDIVYTIHFQNLGTYYASYVTIIDTLSPDFDITTLKVISSSHDYTVSIVDSNILKFSFQNINLIDAATDSLLSNSFIKFSIQPKLNTSIGNEISNNAFITFDYNEAIQTNTVHHEIGKDFLKPTVISITKNNVFKDVTIKVYPNPTSAHFTFEINKDVPKNAELYIYTLDGNEIYNRKNISLINFVPTGNWNKGLYLFELKSGNTVIQSGKIILQ